MKEAETNRFLELTNWASQHGARLHPSIEIYNDDTTKFSLRVKQSASPLPGDGADSFAAVSCPHTITLSFVNALIGGPLTQHDERQPTPNPTFPASFMDQVPPHVIGRFFLIHEYLKGRDSFWWPYIATLPQPEQISSWTLPAFWPDEDIDVLEGTNAHVAILEIQANVKREFKQARKILKEEGFTNWQDYSKMLYNWAFCIFTSRSFRPSLILSESAKQTISSLITPSDCEIDDFSILQPLFDIANHNMTARYEWDISSEPGSCQLICRDSYQPGEQVYNNYGLKSNSELFLGYGFILPELPTIHNDYVHVRKRAGGEQVASEKPKDFLISLRPMSDPSSLLGRSRQVNANASRLHTLAQFSHFEPGLIYDLAYAMSTDDEKRIIENLISTGPVSPTQTSQAPEGLQELVRRIQQALYAKLQYDYEILKELDPTVGSEEGEETWEPANRNQELAVNYRKQCEKVLLAAVQAVAL